MGVPLFALTLRTSDNTEPRESGSFPSLFLHVFSYFFKLQLFGIRAVGGWFLFNFGFGKSEAHRNRNQCVKNRENKVVRLFRELGYGREANFGVRRQERPRK